MGKNRILVLSPYYPYPLDEGGHIRTYNIIKALSKENDVYLFAFLTKQEKISGELTGYCKDIYTLDVPPYSRDFLSRLLRNIFRILHSGHPSLDPYVSREAKERVSLCLDRVCPGAVIIEHSWLAEYVHSIKAHGIKAVLDAIDVETTLWKQFFIHARSWKKIPHYFFMKTMARHEKKYLPHFDAILTVSKDEEVTLKSIAPGTRIVQIPNGVDLTRYKKNLSEGEEKNTILFIGLMRHPPNVQSVFYFYRDIFPSILRELPEVKWYIAGKDPPAEILRLSDGKNVHVVGYVPDALELMSRCSLMVVPLLQGTGTRFKIVEAMALGKTIVSTSIGAEGLHVVHGKHIWIADSPEGFSQAVVTLLKDPELRTSIGRQARTLVESSYSWDFITDRLVWLVKDLLAG